MMHPSARADERDIKMIELRYSNTNTFFIGGLLIDTGYAGTLNAFYKALKAEGIIVNAIKYVMATHYHPDHMGLISALAAMGAKHLLLEEQRAHIHFSDRIFEHDGIACEPLDERNALIIPCSAGRAFLSEIGVSGEIVSTPSHSPDSVSVVLDRGDCIVGDLEPYEYIDGYNDNEPLARDWELLLSHHPKRIFFAHMPERLI